VEFPTVNPVNSSRSFRFWGWIWWCKPVIPATKRWREEDLGFRSVPANKCVRPYLKNKLKHKDWDVAQGVESLSS
jgi:hypothetical protein